jgi:hypothetical protein
MTTTRNDNVAVVAVAAMDWYGQKRIRHDFVALTKGWLWLWL